MTKRNRPGWTPVTIRLTRRDSIALLKVLTFVRTSFPHGVAFLAPVERAVIESLETTIRDVVARGRGATQVRQADEIVEDYIVLYMRKTKVEVDNGYATK